MAADYQRWEFELALRDIEAHQLDRPGSPITVARTRQARNRNQLTARNRTPDHHWTSRQIQLRLPADQAALPM
jgi:hypothetical protein